MTPSDARLSGVFPVLSTPFDREGGCDQEGLERLVDHAAHAGAHGAVYPAIASEFATLSFDERTRMVAACLAAARRRGLPLIVGISADMPEQSILLTLQAAEEGASGVMLMAPRGVGTDAAAVSRFCAAVAGSAGDMPIILQNAPLPLGSCLPVATIRAVLAAVPAIRYVKEENVPCGQRITGLLTEPPPSLRGVMGGAGGRFVLDEYARGACGSMPSCEAVEAHVAIWSAVQAADAPAARDLFCRLLPLLTLGSVFRQAVVKHVLLRRGLIACAAVRDDPPALDAYDRQEIAAILDGLRPVLATVSQGAAATVGAL